MNTQTTRTTFASVYFRIKCNQAESQYKIALRVKDKTFVFYLRFENFPDRKRNAYIKLHSFWDDTNSTKKYVGIFRRRIFAVVLRL